MSEWASLLLDGGGRPSFLLSSVLKDVISGMRRIFSYKGFKSLFALSLVVNSFRVYYISLLLHIFLGVLKYIG